MFNRKLREELAELKSRYVVSAITGNVIPRGNAVAIVRIRASDIGTSDWWCNASEYRKRIFIQKARDFLYFEKGMSPVCDYVISDGNGISYWKFNDDTQVDIGGDPKDGVADTPKPNPKSNPKSNRKYVKKNILKGESLVPVFLRRKRRKVPVRNPELREKIKGLILGQSIDVRTEDWKWNGRPSVHLANIGRETGRRFSYRSFHGGMQITRVK